MKSVRRAQLAAVIAVIAALLAFQRPATATHLTSSVDSRLFYEIEKVSKEFSKKLDKVLFSEGFMKAETREALVLLADWLRGNQYPRIGEFLDSLDEEDTAALFDVFRKGTGVGSTEYMPVVEAPELVGQSTVLGFPFKGMFYVIQGNGGSVSHQKGTRNEYAWDFVIMKKGQMFRVASHKNEYYYAWEQPAVAPAPGRVAETRIEEDDHPPLTTKLNRANYVITQHEDGEYSFIYHVRKDSVAVKPGDEVKFGDQVAKIGDTGISMFPHIHFEMDRRKADKYEGMQARFACYFAKHADEENWRLVISGIPQVGEYIIGIDDQLDMLKGGSAEQSSKLDNTKAKSVQE